MRLLKLLETFVCDYCGGQAYPEPNRFGVRVLEESLKLNCPVCPGGIALAGGVIEGVPLVHCQSCGGIQVAMGEFPSLIAVLRSQRGSFHAPVRQCDASALDRRIRCPQCETVMDAHFYGGPGNVVIDSCEQCEANWLDRGELERIVGAPDHDYAREGIRLPLAQTFK